MNKKENCFSLIRLIVALSVVYQHALLSGMNLPNIQIINWIDKVPIFFFISAYSIAMSLDYKKQSIKEYGVKRFLRLYPELWISLILEIIILIIQFPKLLTNIGFYLWIFAQATLFQFWTPECLRFYGNGTPNGSLWTNVVFVQFYIVIYYLWNKIKKLDLKQDIIIFILLIACNSFVSIFQYSINIIIIKLAFQTLIPYLYMLYLGILFYKYSDKLIGLCVRYFWLIFILFILANKFNYLTNFIPHTYNTGTVIHVIVCCIFTFAFAYKFPELNIKNDYSYGIYVLHMVVMNFFVHNQIIKNSYLALITIYVVTIVLAIVSNKISKPIIKKLKAVL